MNVLFDGTVTDPGWSPTLFEENGMTDPTLPLYNKSAGSDIDFHTRPNKYGKAQKKKKKEVTSSSIAAATNMMMIRTNTFRHRVQSTVLIVARILSELQFL